MAILEDTQVIEEVLSGRTDVFRVLIERHQAAVFRFVGNFVMDHHHREDVAQEVFLAAYANLASYDSSRAAFSTWLFTIARNKCLNLMKKKRGRVERTEHDFTGLSDPTPRNHATEDDFMLQLDRALGHLSLEQRTAFVLAEIAGCSYEEIARIEQAPVGTVKSRINRAKLRLRSSLKQTMEPQ